jgi:DNA-binding transcriptional ArsR family regulator
MPVELRFGADDLTRCRFAVSPLCETHEAVRTLRRTDRRAFHLPWLRRTAPAAAALDLAELWLLMPHPGYTPDFLGPPPDQPYTTPVEFAAELARLRATDPALAAREIARSLSTTPGAATSPAAGRLLADPAATVQRLADTTERAWHTLVEPDWPRLRAVLESDIAYRSRRLAATGLAALLATLHPHLAYQSNTLHLHLPAPAPRRRQAAHPVPSSRPERAAGSSPEPAPGSRSLGGRGLLLMPSVFSWPEPVTGFADPWQPAVIYPARGIDTLWRPAAPDGTLVALLGANRAAILACLAEPASTTELARRHGLAPSSVSAHLSVLRAAGLLTAHRDRHHVLYERTPLGTALTG